jgi:hypothetical protein
VHPAPRLRRCRNRRDSASRAIKRVLTRTPTVAQMTADGRYNAVGLAFD